MSSLNFEIKFQKSKMFIMKGFQLKIKFGLKVDIQAVCLICIDEGRNKC